MYLSQSSSVSRSASDAHRPAPAFTEQLLKDLSSVKHKQDCHFEAVSSHLRSVSAEISSLRVALMTSVESISSAVEHSPEISNRPTDEKQPGSARGSAIPTRGGEFRTTTATNSKSCDKCETDSYVSPSAADISIFNPSDVMDKLKQEFPSLGVIDDEQVPSIRDGFLAWARAMARRHLGVIDFCFGFVIFVNSVTIGVETAHRMQGEEIAALQVLEQCFLLLYLIELGLRFLGSGWAAFASAWTKFDLFMVIVGIGYQWILYPITAAYSAQRHPVAKLMLLRMCKMMRVLRALRIIDCFKSLWMLVRGLFNSLDSMFAAMVMLFLALYIFACAGAELISQDEDLRHDPTTASIIEHNFDTLFSTMLTLGQVASMDSISSVYYPLIKKRWDLTFFFVPLYIVVHVAIMNLVTATLVEGAMHRGEQDRAAANNEKLRRAKALIPQLHETFNRMDTNRSGTITKNEVAASRELLPKAFSTLVTVDDLLDLFDVLDVTGSGEVSETDFIDGVIHVALSELPLQAYRLIRMQQLTLEKTTAVEKRVNNVWQALHARTSGRRTTTSQPSEVVTVDFGFEHTPRVPMAEVDVGGNGSRLGRRSGEAVPIDIIVGHVARETSNPLAPPVVIMSTVL